MGLQVLEAGIAAILNEEAVATRVTNASHRRWREYRYERLGNLGTNTRVYFRHNRGHSLLGRGSLREFFEGQENRGGIGLIAAKKIEAGEFDGVKHTGRFTADLGNLVDDGLGAIERRGVGQLGVSDSIAAILCRQKTARDDFEPQAGEGKQADVDEQNDDGQSGKPRDGVAIGVRAPREDFVETLEEPAEQAIQHALKQILLRAARPEEERGERGR